MYFMLGLGGFLAALPCSQVGTFLVIRRMSLVGDAMSHSVLPGIVLGFLISKSLSSPWLILGAGLAGFVTTVLIELIHQKSRIKQDAAIGVVFTTLFAFGVLLISRVSDKVDLDTDCVLHGDLEHLVQSDLVSFFSVSIPAPLLSLFVVALMVVGIVTLFYRVLFVVSFDTALASSLRYRPILSHYLLMALTSFVVVAAFQVVGAILVVSLLILPGATASLCAVRLPKVLLIAALHSLLSSVGGVCLAVWTDMNTGASIVLFGAFLFMLAWGFGPLDGLLWQQIRRRRKEA